MGHTRTYVGSCSQHRPLLVLGWGAWRDLGHRPDSPLLSQLQGQREKPVGGICDSPQSRCFGLSLPQDASGPPRFL